MDTITVYGTASNTHYSEYAFLSSYGSGAYMGGLGALAGLDINSTDYQAAADAYAAANDIPDEIEEIVVNPTDGRLVYNSSYPNLSMLISYSIGGMFAFAFVGAAPVTIVASGLTAGALYLLGGFEKSGD